MAIRSLSAIIALEPNSTETRACSSRLKPWIMAGCLGLLTAGSAGCRITSNAVNVLRNSECIDEFMVGYRNRAMAEKAWHCQKHMFGKREFQSEFRAGFIAGYLDIANGGAGCCPKLAPAAYWGWRYQSAQGQAAVNAWFEGFPLGVRAAEQDGVGSWQQIRTFGCGSTAAEGSVQSMPQQMPAPGPLGPGEYYDPEFYDPQDVETQMDGVEPIMTPPPEPDFNGNFNGYSLSDFGDLEDATESQLESSSDELVPRFNVAQLPKTESTFGASGATTASINDQRSIEIVPPAQSLGASDVDPSSGQASDQLPFSFE